MSESSTEVAAREGRGPQEPLGKSNFRASTGRRKALDAAFAGLVFVATIFGIVVLAFLLQDVFREGVPRINWDFLTGGYSPDPTSTGIFRALVGSALLILVTALIVVPLGVGAAIYLEEYAEDTRLNRLVEVNIANLAAVPSIVYGILGLGIFVQGLAFFGTRITPGMGPVLLAGALTLTLLVLPVVIIATREALRAVPDTLREGGLALGATRWEVIRSHILPSAVPGALTGTILALSRAIGETAPLIVVGASLFLIGGGGALSLDALFDRYMAVPLQIYDFISRPQAEFEVAAAAAIVVLLVVMLAMNSVAIVLRNRFQSRR